MTDSTSSVLHVGTAATEQAYQAGHYDGYWGQSFSPRYRRVYPTPESQAYSEGRLKGKQDRQSKRWPRNTTPEKWRSFQS